MFLTLFIYPLFSCSWEEETIHMLNQELRRSDEMIEALLAELEELRK